MLTDTLGYYTPMFGGTSSFVGSLRTAAAGYDVTYSYSYDANGNILFISDGTNTTTYAYDSANQLIRENNQAAGKTWMWTYDDGGNITSRTEYPYSDSALGTPVETVSYTYGDSEWGDLLTGYNGSTITSDTIGNMLSDGTWTYTWEHGRELASMSDGTATWTYTYNADGIRTSRSNGTATYSYIYNGSSLSQMTVGSDTLYFAYDASTPMSVTYNGTTYYYVTNLQGDIVAILDSAGTAVVTYAYDAWGNPLSISGSMADTLGAHNPLRYRGYVYDVETGLYYLQSRYYNPELGRFINTDAYTATGQGFIGNNMFAYCLNNPINCNDPYGALALWYYLFHDGDWGYIHRAVQAHIRTHYGGNIITEVVLPGLGRADIVNKVTGDVWEVKHASTDPLGRAAQASIQARSYCGGMSNNKIRVSQLGPAHAFSGHFTIAFQNVSYRVDYWTPQAGVVLYSVQESRNNNEQPFATYVAKSKRKQAEAQEETKDQEEPPMAAYMPFIVPLGIPMSSGGFRSHIPGTTFKLI